MPESTAFIEFAQELLSLLGPVRARRLFGGHGLYLADRMIGLVDDNEVFLKTDEVTRPRFLAAGCNPWIYSGRNGRQETSYYRPPDEAHESPEAMLPWARLALEAADRTRAAKPRKKTGKARSAPPAAARKKGRRTP